MKKKKNGKVINLVFYLLFILCSSVFSFFAIIPGLKNCILQSQGLRFVYMALMVMNLFVGFAIKNEKVNKAFKRGENIQIICIFALMELAYLIIFGILFLFDYVDLAIIINAVIYWLISISTWVKKAITSWKSET